MARMARLVVPGYPHHVTQRGNRRQQTFFSARDYRKYAQLVSDRKSAAGITIWAYCLMPNHVHLIVVPERCSSLAELFSEVHREYTRHINLRRGWRGHLWQGRFFSCVMDERHVIAAARYVELNPVRANLCRQPEQWPWSSARAHLSNRDDTLVSVRPMLELVDDWQTYLRIPSADCDYETIRLHSRTGRPWGDKEFVETLERSTGRALKKKKPGPRRSSHRHLEPSGDS